MPLKARSSSYLPAGGIWLNLASSTSQVPSLGRRHLRLPPVLDAARPEFVQHGIAAPRNIATHAINAYSRTDLSSTV